MAKLEMLNGFESLNVTAAVGKHGVNLKDDVIVVQSLLKYVLEGYTNFEGEILPEPVGTMDKNTVRLIKKYQQNLNRLLKHWRLSVDGRVDPAKDGWAGGRENRRWTIVLLNEEADMKYRQTRPTPGGYIKHLRQRFPPLDAVLESSVGTLGLSLEPSERPLGSLSLSLS